MGGDCPQTCCKGWLIPLDEDDLVRYSNEKGRLGLSLFTATAGFTRNRINLFSGECRYHTREGLCRLQLEKGHDFIPWACRSFPRFYRNYGELEERYLDLSCIAAADIFVRNAGNLRIVEDEGEPETRPCTTNDDKEYLETLINIRRDIIETITGLLPPESDPKDMVSGSSGPGGRNTEELLIQFGKTTDLLYSYACSLQDMYAKGSIDTLIPRFSEYQSREDKGKIQCFPFSMDLFRRLTESLLYYFGQKKTGPELHVLLKDAQSFIVRYRKNEGAFTEMVDRLFNCTPSLFTLLAGYMSYYLYQYFPEAYETYSFRKLTAIGIIHTNMILFLLLVSTDRKYRSGTDTGGCGTDRIIEEAEIAYIIAIYNRKAYFNETVQNDLYRIFEQQRD